MANNEINEVEEVALSDFERFGGRIIEYYGSETPEKAGRPKKWVCGLKKNEAGDILEVIHPEAVTKSEVLPHLATVEEKKIWGEDVIWVGQNPGKEALDDAGTWRTDFKNWKNLKD
jgi:hypothetical protein